MDQDIIDWLNGGTAWGLPEVPMPDEARVKAQCFMLREKFYNMKEYLGNWKLRAIARRKAIDYLLAFIEVNMGEDARDRAKQLAASPPRQPCHWEDDLGICCNPYQTNPFSSKCPAVQAACPGYTKDGHLSSRTLAALITREKKREEGTR